MTNTATDYRQGKKFRPQQFSWGFRVKHPVKISHYNYRPYWNLTLKNYLHYVFSVLHYRSSHAPEPIQRKWRRAAIRFEQQHRKIL